MTKQVRSQYTLEFKQEAVRPVQSGQEPTLRANIIFNKRLPAAGIGISGRTRDFTVSGSTKINSQLATNLYFLALSCKDQAHMAGRSGFTSQDPT